MARLKFQVTNCNFSYRSALSGQAYYFVFLRGADNVYDVDEADLPYLLGLTKRRGCCGNSQGTVPYFVQVTDQ